MLFHSGVLHDFVHHLFSLSRADMPSFISPASGHRICPWLIPLPWFPARAWVLSPPLKFCWGLPEQQSAAGRIMDLEMGSGEPRGWVRRRGVGGTRENLSEEMTVGSSPFYFLGLTCKRRGGDWIISEASSSSHLWFCQPQAVMPAASAGDLGGESLGYLFTITWLAISKMMQALVKVQRV